MKLADHPLARAAVETYKAASHASQARALRSGRRRVRVVGRYAPELSSPYYVTTDKGILRLRDGRIERILGIPTHGLSVWGDHAYLTCFTETHTYLVQTSWAALKSDASKLPLERRHASEVFRKSARFHQVATGPATTWLTNTPHNTLEAFDTETGALQRTWVPFHDPFGSPIKGNQNHINSVTLYGDTMLFCALYAGPESMLCVSRNQRVLGFPYRNTTVHDAFIAEQGLLFCDSFGERKLGARGRLLVNGADFDPVFFENSSRTIRGLAGSWDELLIGNSYFDTERRKRFSGRGSVLVAREGRVVDEIEIPAAQVYVIVREDGTAVEPGPQTTSYEGILAAMEGALGPPTYEGELTALETLKP